MTGIEVAKKIEDAIEWIDIIPRDEVKDAIYILREIKKELRIFFDTSEKYKWHSGSPVGVVKEICNIEIMEENGDCFLMTFFPNSAYKFSSMNANFKYGYVNIDRIKAWRYHEPYDEVEE